MRFEKFALKRSDAIVSNLQNYGEHIKDNIGLDREFTWISNGVDLDELSQVELLDESTKSSIPKDKFIVGYTGTVGVANAMDSFCESAVLLENQRDILFVIVGDGQEKKKLLSRYAKQKNILFIDSIAKKQVQSMLALFDVCFLGWNKEDLYRYGTSANKIFDYMYSGKPIINAYSGSGDIVELAQCGVRVEAKNPQAISKAIIRLFKMTKEERMELGKNGKNYVLEQFTYKKLASKYKELF